MFKKFSEEGQLRSVLQTQRHWNTLGMLDAMWAIKAEDPDKLGDGWEVDAFFATGRQEIDGIFERLAEIGVMSRRRRALDFGCGIGRLTQQLAARFDEAVGVDIAPSMIERARSLLGGLPNCEFKLNDTPDLKQFSDGYFDFVYSNIVLQHVPRRLARSYIAEFIRVLSPGGVAVFQLPDADPINPRFLAWRALQVVMPVLPKFFVEAMRRRRYRRADPSLIAALPSVIMQMHGLSPKAIRYITERNGAQIATIDALVDIGPSWHDYRYVALKNGAVV